MLDSMVVMVLDNYCTWRSPMERHITKYNFLIFNLGIRPNFNSLDG